jgi:hypothetical protein
MRAGWIATVVSKRASRKTGGIKARLSRRRGEGHIDKQCGSVTMRTPDTGPRLKNTYRIEWKLPRETQQQNKQKTEMETSVERLKTMEARSGGGFDGRRVGGWWRLIWWKGLSQGGGVDRFPLLEKGGGSRRWIR